MPRMFNFAWVDASETVFDQVTHAREDERVYSFEFDHVEGDFASLKITIRNPRVGLLALGRKTWLWFSTLVGSVQTPLFFGRLVGVPNNIFQETIEIEFIGRPSDFVAQKLALAETLKVAPYWDPLFVKEESLGDPDVVLEARTALWHVDPVTHDVTISDLVIGEDGTVIFTGDDYYDGDMELSISNTPARSAVVKTSIQWDNQGAGTIDFTNHILENWINPVGNYGGIISSYTFEGLMNDWPKDQTRYSGGYYVQQSYLINVTNQHVPPMVRRDPVMEKDDNFPTSLPTGSLTLVSQYFVGGFGFFIDPKPYITMFIPLGWGVPKFVMGYAASRSYTENLSITINCAVQDVVTMRDEDETIEIDVPANSASAIILGEIPIENVGRRSYVLSDTGLERSLPHLIAIGRANLVARSRGVRLVFTTSFEHALQCSLRKNALVYNPRLPGGQLVGKIVGISYSLDGGVGSLTAKITVACCAGRGGDAYVPQAGDPAYVEEGYVELGYQRYDNTISVLSTNDVAFTVETFEPDDDGIDFTQPLQLRDVLRFYSVSGKPMDQADAVVEGSAVINPGGYGVAGTTTYDEAKVREIIREIPTKINMQLKPLTTGPFETDVNVVVSDLIIPKQIDLEAEAVS